MTARHPVAIEIAAPVVEVARVAFAAELAANAVPAAIVWWVEFVAVVVEAANAELVAVAA